MVDTEQEINTLIMDLMEMAEERERFFREDDCQCEQWHQDYETLMDTVHLLEKVKAGRFAGC